MKSAGKMTDLKLRFVSALVLGPLVLLVCWLGGGFYDILIMVAGVLFLREWLTITGTPLESAPGITGFLTLLAAAECYHWGLETVALAIVVAGALLGYALGRGRLSARWAVEGIFYASFAVLSLIAIRRGEQGLVFVFFLLIVIWSTDVCAYFVGRFVGGPKLWPRVSPKKTWSGALGGLIFAIILSGVFVFLCGQADLWRWMMWAFLLSIVSQLGDLGESALKRRFDVKDSSDLIPGHGGIMDRVDGLVAAAIFAALAGVLLGGSISEPVSGLGLG